MENATITPQERKSLIVEMRQIALLAAQNLNSGARVAMIIGQGALYASEEVEEVVDLLGGTGVTKARFRSAVVRS